MLYEKALHDEGDLDCLPNEDLSKRAEFVFPTPRTRTKAIVLPVQTEEVLNRRSVKDIIIHGITNNRVWIILGAAAPFYDDVFGLVSEWLADKGLQLNQLVGEQTVAWWQFDCMPLSFS